MSKRRPNWSTNEIVRLVQSCTSLLTGQSKACDNFWKEVAEMVNSVGGHERSDEEVCRKWTDLKSQTKIKERKNRNISKSTGGGPPPRPLVEWEEMIISAMPVEAIEGLVGGTDTFCGSYAFTSVVTSVQDLGGKEVNNSNTSKQNNNITMSDEQPGPSTGVVTEDSIKEDNTKGKPAKRKAQNNDTVQEKLLTIEEKKLKLKEDKLQLEKEKIETLKTMSENVSKIYVLLKHRFIEDEVAMQFLEP